MNDYLAPYSKPVTCSGQSIGQLASIPNGESEAKKVVLKDKDEKQEKIQKKASKVADISLSWRKSESSNHNAKMEPGKS